MIFVNKNTPSALLVPPSVPGLWHSLRQYGKLLMCEVHSRLYQYLPVRKTMKRRWIVEAYWTIVTALKKVITPVRDSRKVVWINSIQKLVKDFVRRCWFLEIKVSRFTTFYFKVLPLAKNESTNQQSCQWGFAFIKWTEFYFRLHCSYFEIINDRIYY